MGRLRVLSAESRYMGIPSQKSLNQNDVLLDDSLKDTNVFRGKIPGWHRFIRLFQRLYITSLKGLRGLKTLGRLNNRVPLVSHGRTAPPPQPPPHLVQAPVAQVLRPVFEYEKPWACWTFCAHTKVLIEYFGLSKRRFYVPLQQNDKPLLIKPDGIRITRSNLCLCNVIYITKTRYR